MTSEFLRQRWSPAPDTMEAEIRRSLSGICKYDCFDHALQPEFHSCDYAKKSVTIRYHIFPWMRNVLGIPHGGIYAAMCDDSMGINASYWAGTPNTPTISMQQNFLHAADEGDTLLFQSVADSVGRSLIHVSVQCWAEKDPSRILMTATGVYYNPGTKQ